MHPTCSLTRRTRRCYAIRPGAFEALPSLTEIVTAVVAENVASARVFEKCGFERVGMITERWEKEAELVDLILYRRVASGRRGKPAAS